MTESDILKQIQTLSTGDVRLWRNQIGQGYQGLVVKKTLHTITLAQYRHINFGIPGVGGSDLIGLSSTIITPAMVGKRVAIFTAIEVKSETGKPTHMQTAFTGTIHLLGGHAGVAKMKADAENILVGRSGWI